MAGRPVAEFVDLVDRRLEVVKQWPQARQHALACFGGRDAAGRAIE